MSYIITQKPSFLSNLVSLSRSVQSDVVRAIEELIDNAENYQLKNVKKLAGYRNMWRYRIGDHRIIYSVSGRVVQLLAVGPRASVYERFGIEGDELNVQLIEQTESALEPEKKSTYVFRYDVQSSPARQLPKRLTSALLSQWLVPTEYHEVLATCKTEDDLLAANIPGEQLERVLDCLWPPSSDRVVQQVSLVLEKPEDLLRYAQGDLVNFLLKLDPEQEKLIDWSLTGPTLVKGGPGSGKSTVALYRAAGLFSRTERQQPRVLFTTYTTALIKVSEQLLERLCGGRIPRNLTVENIDRVAAKIVSAQLKDNFEIVSGAELKAALSTVRRNFELPARNSLEYAFVERVFNTLSDKYLLEEIEWVIEGQGCITELDYLSVERVGRGYAFNEALRRAVWKLYECLREYIGDKYTFGQLRLLALDSVRTGRWKTKYDYVLVDEAQDLSPTALALCVELCTSPQGIFLTADASQSLYNRGFRWKKVHSDLRVSGRTRLLTRNYRSTRQISEAAAELLLNTDAGDNESLQQEYRHQGIRPRIAGFDSENEQVAWIVQELYRAARELRLPLGAAAILVPNNHVAEEIAALARVHSLPARYMRRQEIDIRSPEVKVITMHSAKGLEFPIVCVPFLSNQMIPGQLNSQDESAAQEQLNTARRLLYVALTRAMRVLILSYPKQNPSIFLQNLSSTNWEWVYS